MYDKKLIVYFSESGNTKKLAEMIQAAVGGDMVDIKAPKPDFAAYDLIFLGTPNYSATVAGPMADYIKSIDFYINLNEQYVHKQEEELRQKREEWKRKAAESNPKAEAIIRENLGDQYEIWFKHDILTALNVAANTEKGILYAQGAIVPFNEIMEVHQGRKNLKLLTGNSLYPYIIMDFDVQAINPVTGLKYKEEIAAKIKQHMK